MADLGYQTFYVTEMQRGRMEREPDEAAEILGYRIPCSCKGSVKILFFKE